MSFLRGYKRTANDAARQSTGPRPNVALSRNLAAWWPPRSVPHVAVLALPGPAHPRTSAGRPRRAFAVISTPSGYGGPAN